MGTRNKLTDLNNHLFEQLERLNNEDLNEDELKKEIDRSRAVTSVSAQIIDSGQLAVDALKATNGHMSSNTRLPKLFDGEVDYED